MEEEAWWSMLSDWNDVQKMQDEIAKCQLLDASWQMFIVQFLWYCVQWKELVGTNIEKACCQKSFSKMSATVWKRYSLDDIIYQKHLQFRLFVKCSLFVESSWTSFWNNLSAIFTQVLFILVESSWDFLLHSSRRPVNFFPSQVGWQEAIYPKLQDLAWMRKAHEILQWCGRIAPVKRRTSRLGFITPVNFFPSQVSKAARQCHYIAHMHQDRNKIISFAGSIQHYSQDATCEGRSWLEFMNASPPFPFTGAILPVVVIADFINGPWLDASR